MIGRICFHIRFQLPPGVVEGRRSRRPSNPEPLPWRKGSKGAWNNTTALLTSNCPGWFSAPGRESNGRARSSSRHLAWNSWSCFSLDTPKWFYLHQYIEAYWAKIENWTGSIMVPFPSALSFNLFPCQIHFIQICQVQILQRTLANNCRTSSPSSS